VLPESSAGQGEVAYSESRNSLTSPGSAKPGVYGWERRKSATCGWGRCSRTWMRVRHRRLTGVNRQEMEQDVDSRRVCIGLARSNRHPHPWPR